MDLKEKASYLMGLIEGAKIDLNKEENKILKALVGLTQEMAQKLCEIEKTCDDNSMLIDEIDEDLANIEKDVYKHGKTSCSHKNFKGHCNCEEEENYEEEDKNKEYLEESDYEVSCPSCKRVVELNDEIFENEDIICPECGEKIDFGFKEN